MSCTKLKYPAILIGNGVIGMANKPEKRVKLLNEIEYNLLEKGRIRNPARAKEIARHWLKLSR